MKVQILQVSVSTKTSKTGKNFQNAEIAYKNFDSGKVESRNITEYSKTFKAVVETKPGQCLDVESQKNENGFWEWVAVKRIIVAEGDIPQTSQAPQTPGTLPPAVSTPVRSTYETAEERAKKQVYIVRQSCLAQAVAFSLGGHSRDDVSEDDVMKLAQRFTDWIFQKEDLFDLPNDLPEVI